jgi:hypothetical protein
MRGEFPIDLDRSPVTGMPQLEGFPELATLLATDAQHGAIAVGMQTDIALAVEFEFVAAGKVMQPAPLHFEIAWTRP